MKNKVYTSPEVIVQAYNESDVMLASGIVDFNPEWVTDGLGKGEVLV